MFRTPEVVLFTRHIEQTVAFYTAVGFQEVLRVPADGKPTRVDLELDGYRLGFATSKSVREDHWLDPVTSGQRAAVVLWTDDAVAGLQRLVDLGATPVHEPQPWLEDLLIAWATDPDGHLVQVVQRAGRPS